MKVIMYIKREFRCTDLKYIIGGAIITLALGMLSAIFGGSPTVYRLLLLPKFAPPPFVFVIVWTILYIAIGAAAGIVFANREKSKKSIRTKGIILYCTMLLVLFLWYPIFFGANAFFIALIDLVLIGIAAFFTTKAFVKISLISGLIMLVFMLWIAFAFLLNLSVILLN